MIDADNFERWRIYAVILITVFLSVAPRILYLDIPFGTDEGVYAYVADNMRHGGIPYVNAFDHKPPFIYYIYYISFSIFGHSLSAPRIMVAFFVAAAVWLNFRLVHRVTKKKSAAIFSSLILGLATFSPVYQGYSANTELFTLPFIIIGILLLSDETPSVPMFFASGLSFGIGFMIKQPVAVIAVFAVATHIIRMLKMPTHLVRALCFYLFGALSPLLVVILYYYSKGHLATFWEACFSYNLEYVKHKVAVDTMLLTYSAIREVVIRDPVTWISGVAGVLLFIKSSTRLSCKANLVFVLIGSSLAVSLGRRFYLHYFIFMLPVLSIAAGLGLDSLLNVKHSRYVCAGAVLLICFSYFLTARFITMPSVDIMRLNDYYRSYATFVNAKQMGDYLRTHAAKGANLFIAGSEPEIYFYSDLRSATRISYFYPLVTKTRMQEKFCNETLAALVSHPPDYVVIVNNPSSLGIYSIEDNAFMSNLFDMFTHYKLIAVIADNSETLVTEDYDHIRSIAGKGAAMLLLERSPDAAGVGGTFGELLKGKVN